VHVILSLMVIAPPVDTGDCAVIASTGCKPYVPTGQKIAFSAARARVGVRLPNMCAL